MKRRGAFRRKNSPKPEKRNPSWGSSGWCQIHQKYLFLSRGVAKAAARAHGHNDLSPYRCKEAQDFWHNGHLPEEVKQGLATRGEFFRNYGYWTARHRKRQQGSALP